MLNFIVYQIYNFLKAIINIFPSGGGFPESFHTAMSSLGEYLHLLDPIVPISILLTCLLIIFGVEIAIFGFKTIKWIISHIPLIGGKGNH
jgi:hypothetical protein